MNCSVEIFLEGRWIRAAEFDAFDNGIAKGIKGGGIFSYDVAFAGEYLDRPEAAVSCRHPVQFTMSTLEHWPAFLLDMLPSGAARRELLKHHDFKNGPEADWPLLLHGAGNPVGNLRIRQAIIDPPDTLHPGFARDDVIERGEDFIEYARGLGAVVSGSTGAQGDAPKFLLVEDINGRFHADSTLDDEHVAAHWLVKFPRGKKQSDKQILRNEAAYYRVAEQVGLHVGGQLIYENDTLFIPRFDRAVSDRHIHRYGVESLCSASGVAEFGARISQNTLIETIVRYSSNPQEDVQEFFMRDIMNVAMGNTDNHARNSAFLKNEGEVRLSPLFDFAPMVLDDQGIPRVCRWDKNESGARPDWLAIAEALNMEKIDNNVLIQCIKDFAIEIVNLPATMVRCGVDDELITRFNDRIKSVKEQIGH